MSSNYSVKKISQKAEDYLEAILNVTLEKGYARTKDVAGELNISPSSVVEMFQKLDQMNLIEYRKYEGVLLQPKGREIAEFIKYRHDTLKEMLMLINVPEDIANTDACFMEHELHSETVRQIRLLIDVLHEDSHLLEMIGLKIKNRVPPDSKL